MNRISAHWIKNSGDWNGKIVNRTTNNDGLYILKANNTHSTWHTGAFCSTFEMCMKHETKNDVRPSLLFFILHLFRFFYLFRIVFVRNTIKCLAILKARYIHVRTCWLSFKYIHLVNTYIFRSSHAYLSLYSDWILCSFLFCDLRCKLFLYSFHVSFFICFASILHEMVS